MLINVRLMEQSWGGGDVLAELKAMEGRVRKDKKRIGDGRARETSCECGLWQGKAGTVPSTQWQHQGGLAFVVGGERRVDTRKIHEDPCHLVHFGKRERSFLSCVYTTNI